MRALILILALIATPAFAGEWRDLDEKIPQPERTCKYVDIDELNALSPTARDGMVISFDCDILDCAKHAKEKCKDYGGAEEVSIKKMYLASTGQWEDVCTRKCKEQTETIGAICVEEPTPDPPQEAGFWDRSSLPRKQRGKGKTAYTGERVGQ